MVWSSEDCGPSSGGVVLFLRVMQRTLMLRNAQMPYTHECFVKESGASSESI